MKKITTQSILKLKGKRPIVAVTAYDSITAVLACEAGIDLLLVGDSVGTTHLGFESTVPVTMDMMLHHARAVMRVQPQALVVIDIPFGVAHQSFDCLLQVCMECIQQAGVDAIKIEGGAEMAPKIAALVQAGIPVLGHIGLLPQQAVRLGGYRVYGKTSVEQASLLQDANALVAAGVFAVVGEMIKTDCAAQIAEKIAIPLIGIGSGGGCDGQILVSTDLMGMNLQRVPSFVQCFGDVKGEMQKALNAYAHAVRKQKFPG